MAGFVTADEINYLVYRYLQESGFSHAAFAFGNETRVAESRIDGSQVPAGALISFLQRGLAYIEIESSFTGQPSSAVEGARSLLQVHRILSQPRVPETPEAASKKGEDEFVEPQVIPSTNAINLTGHNGAAYALSWHPTKPLLVSAGADEKAVIAGMPGHTESGLELPKTLQHPQKRGIDGEVKGNDVALSTWHPSGEFVATGCFDGAVRVWTESGTLAQEFNEPGLRALFSLEWNPRGNLLAAGGLDKTVAVYRPSLGGQVQQDGGLVQHYKHHSAPILDLAWRDDFTLASASADHSIQEHSVESENVVLCYTGHTGEVNSIAYDPSGTLLASASDDRTSKIWTRDSSPNAMMTLSGHDRSVFGIDWSPQTTETLLLASCSYDHTTKLWDVKTGASIHALRGHKKPVFCCRFSPTGDIIATGSADRSVMLWSPKTGRLIASHVSTAEILDLQWSPQGNEIAFACADGRVGVLDPRAVQDTVSAA